MNLQDYYNKNKIRDDPSIIKQPPKEQIFQAFAESTQNIAKDILDINTPTNLGVMKRLLEGSAAREQSRERASARMKLEIQALENVQHKNLLRIVDSDDTYTWYVSEYQPGGRLTDIQQRFKGDVQLSLRTLRSIVDAISALHAKGYIHRDIKPDNILMSASGDPIVADLGIAYLVADDEDRLTQTDDNVGTWKWMPVWAEGRKLDDVGPAFDIYSLGKTLWWMLSGLPISKLRMWYINHPESDIEKIFKGMRHLNLVKDLLAKSVTEHEKDAKFNSIDQFGAEINKILQIIERGGDKIDAPAIRHVETTRPCKTCGIGMMKLVVDDALYLQIGLDGDKNGFRCEQCDHCGYIDIFAVKQRQPR
jgi:serine/threonine protein kinase